MVLRDLKWALAMKFSNLLLVIFSFTIWHTAFSPETARAADWKSFVVETASACQTMARPILRGAGTLGKKAALEAIQSVGSTAKSVGTFGYDLFRSCGLSLLFRNLPDSELAERQLFGGVLTLPAAEMRVTWANPLSKAFETVSDYPFELGRWLITKTPLRRAIGLDRRLKLPFVVLHGDFPQTLTSEQALVFERILERIKSDHPDATLIYTAPNHPAMDQDNPAAIAFTSLLAKFFPKREEASAVPPLKRRNFKQIAAFLDGKEATVYFFGKPNAENFRYNVESYTQLGAVSEHIRIQPISGPLQYMTRHASFKAMLQYISLMFRGEETTKPSWWSGIKSPTLIGHMAITIISIMTFIHTVPYGDRIWATIDRFDPTTRAISGASDYVSRVSHEMDEEYDHQRIDFIIENDPRYAYAKKLRAEGALDQQVYDLFHTLEDDMRHMVLYVLANNQHQLGPVDSNTRAKYEELANYIARSAELGNTDVPDADTLASRSANMSAEQRATLNRLAFLNNSLLHQLELLTLPADESGQPGWVTYYEKRGFDTANRRFGTLDLTKPDGIQQMDRLVTKQILNLYDFEMVMRYMNEPGFIERLPGFLQARLLKWVNLPFYKQMVQHVEQQRLDPKIAGNIIMVWLNYGQQLEFYDDLGIARMHNGRPVGLSFVENTLNNTLVAKSLKRPE